MYNSLSPGRHTLTLVLSPTFHKISDKLFHIAVTCSDSVGLSNLSSGTDFSFGRLSKIKYLMRKAWTTDWRPLVAFLGLRSPNGYGSFCEWTNDNPVLVHSPLGGADALPKTVKNLEFTSLNQ